MNSETLLSCSEREKDKETTKIIKGFLEDEITCDSVRLRKFITKWMVAAGWDYEDFADFLELMGVDTPAYLSEFDEGTNTFKCADVFGNHYKIYIGIWLDYFLVVDITSKDNLTRHYILTTNYANEFNLPKVFLYQRTIKRDNKTLIMVLGSIDINMVLKFDNGLKLDISLLRKADAAEWEEFITKSISACFTSEFQNEKEVEEYFLSLEFISLSKIYEKLIELLDIFEDDCCKYSCMTMHYLYDHIVLEHEFYSFDD